MYDLDAYLIVYVNCSVKAWFMTDEEFAKAPDIRVFGIDITDEMKTEILDKFASVTKAVDEKVPQPIDLDKFRFNNFKRSTALSLTDEEFDELKASVKRVLKSGLPDWKKQAQYESFEYIREVREKEAG
jgi:hypothetical protein